MANVTWKDSSDNWTTVGDWSNGAVPAAADAVTVAQGDPQITSNVGTIASLNVSAKLDLSNGGALVVTNAAISSGTIGVDAASGTGGSGLTVGGTLTNSGTLNIGNSALAAPITVNLGGLTNFLGTTVGTINIAGGAKGATLAVSGPAGFGVQGTEIGSLSLTGNAVIEFGTGQISTIRGTVELKSAGASIQDHGQGHNSALTGLTSIAAGGLYLSGGASLTTSGALSNAGTLAASSYGVTSLTIGGSLTNTGTLYVGSTYITGNVGVDVLGVLSGSSGTINVAGSSTHTASLIVSGAAGFGAAGSLYGTVEVTNDAVIQFGSSQIKTIQGSLTLNGNATTSIQDQGQGVNSALAGLNAVSGSVELQGITLATTGNLSNTGTIGIDDGYAAGGANVTIGGTLTNTASIQIGNSAQSAHSSVSFGGIVNAVGTTNGKLTVVGGVPSQQVPAIQTTLTVHSAAGFGTTGTLAGSVYLYDDAQILFASGQIDTIASGSQLTLYGAPASISNDGTLNSALTGLTTLNGSLTLQDGATATAHGPLNVTGGLWADFGSAFTVDGTLANSGTVLVGESQLTASSTINAGSLVNSIGSTGGLIDLKGGLTNPATGISQAQALLSVNGAAGFGATASVVGSVNLTDDSVIKFASGGITTITSGSELTLSGAMASITTDGTVNGALAGLSTVAGSLTIQNGASLMTTGSLSDQGTITVNSSESNLTVGGTLTVTGALNISSGSLAAPAIVSVGSLDNVGGGLRSGISVNGQANDPQIGLNNGAATLSVNTAAGFGTQGILQGNVSIDQGGEILFTSGQINTIASGGSLTLTYPMASISNDGSVNSALTGLTTIGGTLELQGGSTLTTTGPMSNTGMVAVVYGSSLTVGGVLTNTGAVTVGGARMSTTLNVDGLTNFQGAATGSIGMFTSSSTDLSTLNVSGTAGFGTAGAEIGTVNLSGHSVIQFGTGQISTIQGSLTLDGASASIQDQGQGANSALTGLTTVSGSLTLEYNASLATGTATPVSDTLSVGNTLTVSGGVSASHVAVQSGGTLILTGGGTVSGPIAVGSGGTFEGIGAAGAVTVASGGTFAPGADPGTMTTGSISLASGSTFGIEIGGTAAGSYDQDQVTGTVSLGGATFHGTLVNGFMPTVGSSFTIISNDGTDAVNGTFAGLAQGGTTDIGGNVFSINYAGGDGNDVVLTDLGLPCYGEGTLILTAAGEVPVERLAVGDMVVTASGERRPIRWIGHRMVDCRSHPDVRSVWPIRIAAHAFGEGRPARDLFVSPDHALCIVCVEEVLIPARRLLNGSTVTRHPIDRIGYWHVELDSHDLLVANGLPAESYLEMGNRRFFGETGTAGRGEETTHAAFCRPFFENGPVLDVVRLQVEARAKRRGWTARHAVNLKFVHEHRTIEGLCCGNTMVALFPAGTGDLHLRSDTFVPDDGDGRGDERSLGVCLLDLSIRGSGSAARIVRLDDPRLEEGFHDAEESGGRKLRWTRGQATLPASLWEGFTGIVALHLDLNLDAIRGWQAPARGAMATDRRPRLDVAAPPAAPTGHGRRSPSAAAPRDGKGSSGYSVTLSQPFMPRRSWGRKRAL